MIMLKKKIYFLAVCVSALFSGCFLTTDNGGVEYENPSVWRPQIPADSSGVSTVKGSARTLRTDDAMLITIIPGSLQPTTIEDIVDANGMVSLPLVGEFLIGGITTSQAEKKFVRHTLMEVYIKTLLLRLFARMMFMKELYIFQEQSIERAQFHLLMV